MSVGLNQQVKNFIQSHHLIQRGEHVLVAVSGGADSVALLNILRELSRPLRLRLTVAHLNHKIRGNSANEDAAFVKQLARRLHLNFALGTAAVPRLAGRLGISLEMAGRRARYDFFEKTALKRGCDVVATAHTADDNAESILLMLIRGCGLQGLTGIAPLSQMGKITVIRPLLAADRIAIEKYLRERNLSWREDISNADPAFLRNRVRHELLPLLEAKFNSGIRETLNRVSGVLRVENDFIERFAEKALSEACSESLMGRKATYILDSRFPPSSRGTLRSGLRRAKEGHGNDRLGAGVCHSRLNPPAALSAAFRAGRESRIRSGRINLNWRNLAKYHIAVRRRVLRRWLLANGVDSETIDFQLINKIDNLIIKPGRGSTMELAGGIIIRRNYQRLEIKEQRTKPDGIFFHKIRIPGRTILPEAGLIVRAELKPGIERERAVFGKFPVRASVSLKKLGRKQILARSWRPGDRMRPYGLKGSKKIQDIFSDAKLPAVMRRRLPIFECGDEIIWIPGYRIAEGWQVSDAANNALQLTVERD